MHFGDKVRMKSEYVLVYTTGPQVPGPGGRTEFAKLERT
jgi:hypothetical protein